MRWLVLVLIGVLGLAAAGCETKLARRELPGAALQFPVGKAKEERLDYQQGKLMMEIGSRTRVQLDWDTGEMMSRDELDSFIVKPLRESLDLSVVQPSDVRVGGSPGMRWHLAGKSIEMVISVWPCGKRYFSLTVAGRKKLDALDQQIRDSFECKPDPARDGKQGLIGVELDVGADFGVTEENPLTFMSLDSDAVVISTYTGRTSLDDPMFAEFVPKFLDGLATAAGMTGTSFKAATVKRGPVGPRTYWRSVGRMDHQRMRMLGVPIDCGAEKYISFHLGEETKPESVGLDMLFGARCSKNPKRPPAFAEVARKACARGDQRGCGLAATE